MLKQACLLCKIVGALAITGAINWGIIGLFKVNLIDKYLGSTPLDRIIYVLVGLSGVALLSSFFCCCPKCKKS